MKLVNVAVRMCEILAYKYAEDRNPYRKQSDNLLSIFRFNQEINLDFFDTHRLHAANMDDKMAVTTEVSINAI